MIDPMRRLPYVRVLIEMHEMFAVGVSSRARSAGGRYESDATIGL